MGLAKSVDAGSDLVVGLFVRDGHFKAAAIVPR